MLFAVLAVTAVSMPARAQSLTDLFKSVAGRVKGGDQVQSLIQQLTSISTPSVAKREDTLGAVSGEQVIFYSTSWCPICKQAREYMRSKEIPFAEYDVEKSDKGKADMEKLNARGVPIMLIGDQKLMGFQPAQFDAAYAKFRAGDHHATADASAASPSSSASSANAEFERGAVLTAKISGVKVYDQPAGSPAFSLSKSDEVVFLGEERDGFLKVQGPSGTGWVQALMVRK